MNHREGETTRCTNVLRKAVGLPLAGSDVWRRCIETRALSARVLQDTSSDRNLHQTPSLLSVSSAFPLEEKRKRTVLPS